MQGYATEEPSWNVVVLNAVQDRSEISNCKVETLGQN